MTPLVHLTLQQSRTYCVEVLSSQIKARRAILGTYYRSVIEFCDALLPMLSPSLYRSIMLSSEKSSSSWVTTLPLTDHVFLFTKKVLFAMPCTFDMAFCCLLIVCVARNFLLSMPFVVHVVIRHNELQGIIAGLLTEFCHSAEVEPSLQPLSGLLLLRMGLIWIVLPMVFGNIVRKLVLMLKCLIHLLPHTVLLL